MRKTVLVVEDDGPIRRGIIDALRFANYATFEAADGEAGLETGLSADVDLVLLDVVMPKMNGFEVLEALRESKPLLPIIILTARGAEDDRVRGLRNGADDYVVKPFSARELLARVEAVLRRSAERPSPVNSLTVAGRVVDFNRREVALPDGNLCKLTDREMCLLRYLAANTSRTVSREELLARVWGLTGNINTRTIDMTVARLREKLNDAGEQPEILLTVRGKGYTLCKEPEEAIE